MPDTATDESIRKITVTNPATGEVLAELSCATALEVSNSVKAARTAQAKWSGTSLQSRLAVLKNFQRVLYEQKDEVAALISDEVGKPRVEALLTEVVVTLDACNFYLRTVKSFLRPERIYHANPAMKSKRSWILREAQGVIGIISPWNYPFSIPASEAMAALVTGNAVVLKPSENSPLTALKLKSLMEEAGLPDGLLQVVIGDGSTGATLVKAALDKLIFTGSVSTGKKIAVVAAEKLMPVVLELGGKDPMLVLEDADLDVASSAAVWGAFMNAGQTCLSVERCYVQKTVYEHFVGLCVKKTNMLCIGKGSEEGTDVGPLISGEQLRTVESHVADAVFKGARVLAGGGRLTEKGPNFYAPTVLVDVTHDMRLMWEETFGPLLPIMPFATDDNAVALANDSQFGLSASVWTRDRARGEALARRIQAGTVMVNDVITCFGISEAPHGGVKASGIGRTHGRLGLDEMVRTKYVDSEMLPRMAKLWWYGYGSDFHQQMRGFADLLFGWGVVRRLRGGMKAAKAFRRDRRV